jgi:hypothetical protein
MILVAESHDACSYSGSQADAWVSKTAHLILTDTEDGSPIRFVRENRLKRDYINFSTGNSLVSLQSVELLPAMQVTK